MYCGIDECIPEIKPHRSVSKWKSGLQSDNFYNKTPQIIIIYTLSIHSQLIITKAEAEAEAPELSAYSVPEFYQDNFSVTFQDKGRAHNRVQLPASLPVLKICHTAPDSQIGHYSAAF